jgi:hypothetical protein
MALGSFPDFTGAFTGTDTSTGKRNIDLFKTAFAAKTPNLGGILTPSPTPSGTTLPEGNAIPSVDPKIQSWLDLYKATSPERLKEMEEAGRISAALSREQLRDLYPFLSAAGAETTARNLAASQAYRAFAEGLPSNVQNIMASKQAQATSAAAGEADRARAVAAQQDAAKNYAGRFAGQYIQVG